VSDASDHQADSTSDYPAHWETHALLKDGSTVEIRPIRADDRNAVARFHGRQSQESIYFRFFRYRPELTDNELDYFTQVDYRDRMAFVAVLGDELVAVARYERLKGRSEAEVAFFVDDDHHGQGLGTLMLEYLAAAARDRGLSGFTATVLPENFRMLAVFRSAGFDVTTRFADGLIEVELGIDITEETSSAIADRQRLSTARSVARIVEPATVAVIGASRREGSIGHALVKHLVEALPGGSDEAASRIFPINPEATEILGLAVHPTIEAATEALQAGGRAGEGGGRSAAPEPGSKPDDQTPTGSTIDLAVIAVRAELVEDVVEQCAAAGVSGLLIISAGFAELGGAGRDRERRLVDLARDNGMRLIGPNAFGLINTVDGVNLQAVFQPLTVAAGRVGLGSQSGPLGAAVLERMRTTGIGVSSFVGVGNRADVSVNDLLDYWDLDPNTDVVVLYVENFGNLANFSTVARRVSAAKPVITIRPSSPDLAELLQQAGVILVDEVSQLAEQALMAASQPVAKGNRVAIVSNTASLARLAVTACRRSGLDVVVPNRLAGEDGVAEGESVQIGDLDTVALLPSSDREEYERTVAATAASAEVDMVLIALAPTAFLSTRQLGRLLHRINRSIDKPMAAIGLVDAASLDVEDFPVFTFPEEAAQVLGRHARWGQWRAARGDADPPAAVGSDRSTTVIDELLAGRDEARLNLASPDLPRLLDELGLPLARYGIAHDIDELQAVADRIGYPTVIKAANFSNRSLGESGGAAIDLHDRSELVAAYERMSEQLGLAMKTAIVQRMVPAANMVRLELLQEPPFGTMISVGPGGAGFESSPPVARRFLPFDQSVGKELVDALLAERVVALITDEGRAALEDLIAGLATAAAGTDLLARVSLNPVMLAGSKTIPVDAEVVLKRRRVDVLSGVRHI
jgi:acyl-CoA synthetase (NDP forming)/RimJ/RimL family protein N-acetyltransferase